MIVVILILIIIVQFYHQQSSYSLPLIHLLTLLFYSNLVLENYLKVAEHLVSFKLEFSQIANLKKMQNHDAEHILAKKYQLVKKIGSGSFGYIYLCKSLVTNKSLAAKIEKKEKGDGQLQYQIKLYQIFKGMNGVPKIHDYGYEGDKLFMIIDLLDHSLEDLFQTRGKKFSLSTVLKIGMQIISRLEAFHIKGFLHRDIKANNFMIGRGDEKQVVYIIDFGLAKRYRDSKTGKHIPFRDGKSLVGTARYASIASHLGYEQGRKDDLESLGFLLLYFLRGKLPWQGVQLKNKTQKYAQIGRIKRQTSISQLCKTLPQHSDVFVGYFDYVRSLSFTDQPNYERLKRVLEQGLERVDKGEDRPLDWMLASSKH